MTTPPAAAGPLPATPAPRAQNALAFALGVACTLIAMQVWQHGAVPTRPLERLPSTPPVAMPAIAEGSARPLLSDEPMPSAAVNRKIDPGGVVNVNTASLVELQQLPGVGPKLAQRILDARARQPFRTVDDLRHVGGIGPKTMDKLRPLVTVGKLD